MLFRGKIQFGETSLEDKSTKGKYQIVDYNPTMLGAGGPGASNNSHVLNKCP